MKRYTPSILSFALSFFVALLPEQKESRLKGHLQAAGLSVIDLPVLEIGAEDVEEACTSED